MNRESAVFHESIEYVIACSAHVTGIIFIYNRAGLIARLAKGHANMRHAYQKASVKLIKRGTILPVFHKPPDNLLLHQVINNDTGISRNALAQIAQPV